MTAFGPISVVSLHTSDVLRYTSIFSLPIPAQRMDNYFAIFVFQGPDGDGVEGLVGTDGSRHGLHNVVLPGFLGLRRIDLREGHYDQDFHCVDS
jgi:hypothetical protein